MAGGVPWRNSFKLPVYRIENIQTWADSTFENKAEALGPASLFIQCLICLHIREPELSLTPVGHENRGNFPFQLHPAAESEIYAESRGRWSVEFPRRPIPFMPSACIARFS